jgi:homoserine dehydrogenase
MRTIGIGLLGLGTVGAGVAKLISQAGPELERRVGARLAIRRIASRDLSKPRDAPVDRKLMTADPYQVINDPHVDILVELIGGTADARAYCLEAVRKGKHLVTANKALLAEQGAELYRAARAHGVSLGFEGSVCGGVPIIRALREGLIANRITSLRGIVNGTCNYILTQMSEGGAAFAEVLARAQAEGYAEADPSLDVDGIDAAHKLQILASIACGCHIDFSQVHVEGIRGIAPEEIANARELGYRIKLLAIAKTAGEALEVRVHPALVPADHLLASVGGVFNAVFIVGDAVGPQMFYGRGAGQMPTASAVLSDIVEIAQDLLSHRSARSALIPKVDGEAIRVLPMTEVRTSYYLRVMAADRPGVLSKVAGVLGAHQISIASVIQKGRGEHVAVPVVMMTHEAREGDMRRALDGIDRLDVVMGRPVCLRVEEA